MDMQKNIAVLFLHSDHCTHSGGMNYDFSLCSTTRKSVRKRTNISTSDHNIFFLTVLLKLRISKHLRMTDEYCPLLYR